jgi:hypothetical protein
MTQPVSDSTFQHYLTGPLVYAHYDQNRATFNPVIDKVKRRYERMGLVLQSEEMLDGGVHVATYGPANTTGLSERDATLSKRGMIDLRREPCVLFCDIPAGSIVVDDCNFAVNRSLHHHVPETIKPSTWCSPLLCATRLRNEPEKCLVGPH